MATPSLWRTVRPLGRILRGLKFIGNHGLTELGFVRGLSYAQFGEDLFVHNFFKHERAKAKFYVDVGAYHPYRFSNTYLFYRNGWRGINIEPNPHGHEELVRHRPEDVNLNIAVTSGHGSVRFICDDAYSGVDDGAYLYGDRNAGSTTITVAAKPLSAVLHEYVTEGQSIDFMSVDCEGHDVKVLGSNDWTRYRPTLILAEDHDPKEDSELNRLMNGVGYRYYSRLHLTKVFVREDIGQ